MFTFNFKRALLFLTVTTLTTVSNAQDSSKFLKRKINDTSIQKLNMDAVYNRPFLTVNKLPLAIGGYIEANTDYTNTDGVNEGLNFQMRRMTLFFSSTVAKKIKFLSELEFEEGTKEINIETSLIDVEFHPLVNLRGGIIMNPIGAFNQNHDGPRWDFIDRPITSTEIIPSTLSNVGFGLHGKYFHKKWVLGYESYLTNGFNDKLIMNEDNRTSFHEAKEDADKFEKSNSGLPLFTSKLAIRNRQIGEIGLSYMTGVYNKWQQDGLLIDNKRMASIMAIDFSTSLFKNKISINGEIAKSKIELPTNYVQTYGSSQMGFYCDVVTTILQKNILGWENAKLNFGLRYDNVDFNQDINRSTGAKLYDEMWALTGSLAFRPVSTAVFRFNYKHTEAKDLVGNAPTKTGSIQFGVSTYF